MKPHFDLEIRNTPLDDETSTQWVVEHSDAGRKEHGPFKSFYEAKKLIALRKLELAHKE